MIKKKIQTKKNLSMKSGKSLTAIIKLVLLGNSVKKFTGNIFFLLFSEFFLSCRENLWISKFLNLFIFFSRVSPKEAAMQYTMRCDYRSYVTRASGEKSGIYPMLVQGKYRIDEKRPMGPNGEEKRPWSKFFRIQELFYHYLRNRLYEI